ncbi:lipid IV(A) 3-deoxy-D-manno-octulosonic acid transferase [Pseudoalteromonas luteoviolacea]|uniref:lipid IV(A) 3-deoxy-D-manno-octulosonic acid transferase n=1 Tax=Pseudoalteromonas luteoviolacea TaxID=43657 RepID=UPI001B367612|nr:lipid IV(A) 3-deoxy-D-manno-octulosonic acid transferase [Pseudoalteromonas luteoviolacea]MBQ4813528.1 lipid IV(A) 3-deoxy-D-manno-octulosonic acid transferase [Pseudoalteromonas luteoviolacea]
MTRYLYSLLLLLLSPFIAFYLYQIRGKRNIGYRSHFGERFGVVQRNAAKNSIVIHCASVGEVLAASPLIKRVLHAHPNERILITCNTPTGRAEIQKQFGDAVDLCYLPIDFAFAAKKFIKTVKPKLLIVLETELWPNLFYYAKKNHCAITVVNARLSEKSYLGYKRFASLSRQMMQHIDVLASHNEEDGRRFIDLGLDASRMQSTGSIKFDIHIDDGDKLKLDALKAQIGNRPVWIAGSTHPNEHEQVIAAHQSILNQHPNTLLIIAPRHPEQFEAVADLLAQSKIKYSRRSNTYDKGCQVLLADTLGELKFIYGSATIAFIGGSLIERGGHNPLEAAASAVGVLSGPSTYNFSHIYPELVAMEGAIICHNKEQLGEQIISYLSDIQAAKVLGNNAHTCLAKNQGAINRTLNVIDSLLEQ